MAEKIVIALDDQTKAGATSVNANLDSMSRHGEKAEASFDKLNDELDDSYAFKASKGYKSVAQSVDEVSASTQKAAAATNGWLKTAVGLFALKETFSKINQVIGALGAGGSRSMQELQGSFATLMKAAVAFTNDPGFSKWISSAAAGVTSFAKGVAGLPDAFRGFNDSIERTIALTGEWFGVFAKGTTETVAGMALVRQEAIALEKQQAEAAVKQAALQKILGTEDARQAAAREASILAEITDQGKLDGMRAQAYRELKALHEAEIVDQEKVQAAAAKYAAANDRARQNQLDTARKVAEQNAEVKERKAKEAADFEKQQAAEVAAVELYWADVRAARAKMLIDKMYEQEAAAADARVRLAEQEAIAKKAIFDKQSANQQGNVKAIAGGLTPKQIADQIAAQRGAAAAQAERDRFRQANAKKIKPAIQAGQKSKAFQDLLRKQEAAAERARQRAAAGARRDVNRGNVSPDEILGAQKELVNKVIDKGAAQGALTKEGVAVLKDATSVLSQQQADINRQAQEIRQVQNALNQILGRGMNANQRAQMAGRP